MYLGRINVVNEVGEFVQIQRLVLVEVELGVQSVEVLLSIGQALFVFTEQPRQPHVDIHLRLVRVWIG